MKINCLDYSLELIEVIDFTYGNGCFKLTIDNTDEYYNIDDKVVYLEITYSSLKDISLLHLFLVQHRQETLLLGKVKIIIIEDFQPSNEEKCILYSPQHDTKKQVQEDQYWLNIATLSVQIGYQVKSISHKDQQVYKETQNEIIVVSAKFPDFDICELDNHFTDFIGETKKDIPVEQLFEKLSFPKGVNIENFENSFLVLLQHISMKIHQIQKFSHFLPMTIAYNAFYIQKQISQSINKKQMNSILLSCQEIYLAPHLTRDQIISKQEVNYFKLPLHLLVSFTFTKDNWCIFQQMCDISYFFKAEFLCIFQQCNNLENAVISQSSRSGKSVTILSVYYYNVLTKQKVPVYLNLAYSTDQKSKEKQPLYDHASVNSIENLILELNQKIYTYFDDYKNDISYQKLLQNSVTASINYQKNFTKVYQQIKTSVLQFDQDGNQKLLEKLFTNIGKQSFINFVADCSIITKTVFKSTCGTDQNINKMLILVDEILQPSKQNFNKCQNVVKILTDFFSQKIISEAKLQLGNVFSIEKLQQMITSQYLFYSQIFVILGIQISNKIDFSKDQSANIQLINDKVNDIIETHTEDLYIYKFLAMKTFVEEAGLEQIIRFICYTSPNFLNLKEYNKSQNVFYECVKELLEFPTEQIFKQSLFKFIMQLYNPRSVETIFWRNIYHDLDITETDETKTKKNFEEEFYKYLGDEKFSPTYFNINLQEINNFQTKYDNATPFDHDWLDFLSIGTDLAVINFIQQNELLYTSTSSRSVIKYIQSHIIGGVQIHSSLLTKNYYQNSKISHANWGQLKQQINERLSGQDILQFYQLLVPELASEIQFVCPLISPQIIIAQNQNNDNFVTNCASVHQYEVNKTTHNIKIINSYSQIINSLQIIRTNKVISLQSPQLDLDGNEIIYAHIKQTQDFTKNLFISTSMQLNQEVVFYFFYKASQNFKLYINYQQNNNTIEYQSEITLLSLKYSTVSEITAILFFIIKITQISIPYFKNYLNSYKMKNLYLELVQITRNTDKTVEKSEYVDPDQVITNLQLCFKNSEFMFLQPCLDFIASIWDTDKISRMDRLMKYLYRVLATCYQSLIRTQSIQSIKPFIIAVPLDKNHLYNKFELNSSVADFLVAFFPGSQQASDDVKQLGQFFKQHIENINNEEITFYTCIVESGLHIKDVLAKKAEINHNYVFQVTPFIGHKQLCERQLIDKIIDHTKLFVESYQMTYEDGQKQQKDEFNQALKEKKLLCMTLHQERVGDGYTPVYIRYDVDQFNQTVTNLFLKLKMQINYDDNWEETCIYIKDIDIKTCLEGLQPLIHSQLISNYRKNIKVDIYKLSVNKTFLIQQWACNQSSNNPYIQALLVNYQHSNIDISKYQIQESCFQGIKDFLILLQNNFNSGGTIKIVNHIINQESSTIQLPITKPNINQIVYFLNQNNLIILGFEKLKIDNKDVYGINTYMVKHPSLIQEVDFTYISSIVEDIYDNSVLTIKMWFNKFQNQSLLIDNYLKKANFIEFNEEIINAVNLNLFMQNLSINKQIDAFFESAIHTDTPIRIKFYNLKTKQFEKQKEKETEIIIEQKDFSLNRVLENLGSRVILASQWIKENNIVILKIVYLFMCQYCQNTDTKSMTTCLECGELLCQEHVLKHSKYFKHFQYRLPNGTVQNLPDIQEEQLPEQVKETSDTKLQKIQFWLSNYDKDLLADPEKTHITNYIKTFKSIQLMQKIAKSANIKLFDPEMTVEKQIDEIFGKALQENQLIQFEYFNLKTKKIEKENQNEVKITISKTNYTVDNVLKLLGRRVILASQYKEKISQDSLSLITLRVVKSVICQYCEITDNLCLVVCQDCGEYLCNQHVQKHCIEFEHFQYQRPNDSFFRLPKTTTMVEQPAPNIQPIKSAQFQTIKQWIAHYPQQRSPEVENYLKLFVNFTEENVRNANQKLFGEKSTVDMQIQAAIDAGIQDAKGGKILLKFTDFEEDKLQNTSTINNPSKEKTIHALFAYKKLFYLKYKIRTSDDDTIINLICIVVQ